MDSQNPVISLVENEVKGNIFFEPSNIRHVKFTDLKTGHGYSIESKLLNSLLKKYPLEGEMPMRVFLQNLIQISEIFSESNVFGQILVKREKKTGTLNFGVYPKSFHFLSFAQNFSSNGKVSLAYELGFRNLLKRLDSTRLKFEQRLNEGSSFEAMMRFPFFFKREAALQYNFLHSNMFLCNNLNVRELSFSITLDEQIKTQKQTSHKIEISKKKLEMNPRFFPDCDFMKFVHPELSLGYSYNSIDNENPWPLIFNSFSRKWSANFSLNSKKLVPNVKLNFVNYNSFYLWKILPKSFRFEDFYKYFMLEIESYNSLGLNFGLRKNEKISIFNRVFLNRMRGFSEVESNFPFPEQINIQNGITDQLIFVNFLKLNMKHFPIFKGSSIHPFWHSTLYANTFNFFKNRFFNWNLGIGLNYNIQANTKIEILYNFFHFNYPRIRADLNKEECFQIRISFND